MQRVFVRAGRMLIWTIVVAIALDALLVKAPMLVTRWRMERLLADFHSIYPTQSTWAEAQRLMTRWGRWGHYDGSCDATDCDYQIEVDDPYSRLLGKLPDRWGQRLWGLHLLTAWAHAGWVPSGFHVALVVQDGKIVRTRTLLNLEVMDSGPPEHWEFPMRLESQVRSRLRRPNSGVDREEAWILGGEDQLADHPDYKVGRPGGCTNCEVAEFTYAPTLDHSDLVRLTTYDLSCLTRLRRCTQIGEVVPAGRDWHLYDADERGPAPSAPQPCRTEVRALGRDAEEILEIEVHSVEKQLDTQGADVPIAVELAQASLVKVLKGSLDRAPGTPLLFSPFSGSADPQSRELPEHVVAGHRYFVLFASPDPDRGDRFSADFCGVLDDTAGNLAALQTGIAQDVPYRHPPQFGD